MSDGKPAATRSSWKIQPCPDQRASLDFSKTYDAAEFEKIKRGLIPREMEDKWFVFFEEPWLYIHRSWTGFCTYGVRFEASPDGATAVEAWASRDASQYRETRTEYDRTLLEFLIDALLLNKNIAFPVPSSAAGSPPGLYQHAIVGRAYPEAWEAHPRKPASPLWKRLRDRFKR